MNMEGGTRMPCYVVKKKDCISHIRISHIRISHIRKRMGTALREPKKKHSGQKLSDGKTIGGQGRLTAITDRPSVRVLGSMDTIVKSVQAT